MSDSSNTMQVRYWGTRGTLPAPGADFLKTGGNTNCIEVICGNEIIIFDAGTGILKLGHDLMARGITSANLLLTHAHYDHVEGIPFFKPLYYEDFSVDMYAGPLDGVESTECIVRELLRRPYFPVGKEVFNASRAYNNLEPGASFSIGDDIKVTTKPLNHPGGATGYRIDYNGSSFACVTDTEHVPGQMDQNVLELIDGVDLFIYDSSYTDSEFDTYVGYGHSTYEEGIRLAKEAGAKRFNAFHHLPDRTDVQLSEIENNIKNALPESGIAREREIIVL